MTTSQRLRETRKHLRNLVAASRQVTSALDAEMAKPSTPERGRTVARIVNHLQLHTDLAERYGLCVIRK